MHETQAGRPTKPPFLVQRTKSVLTRVLEGFNPHIAR